MTNQEFFTKSVTHVMSQKKKCVVSYTCSYAGPDGTSCAVGCVMPREMAEAADNLSNSSDIHTVLQQMPAAAELFKGIDVKLLDACQTVHDTTEKRDEEGRYQLRRQFESIAERFVLEMPNV